jgi:hypothetical protein
MTIDAILSPMLPIIVADDDFLDYIWEEYPEGSMEYDELYLLWLLWAKDNLTFLSRVRMYIQRQKLRSGWYR